MLFRGWVADLRALSMRNRLAARSGVSALNRRAISSPPPVNANARFDRYMMGFTIISGTSLAIWLLNTQSEDLMAPFERASEDQLTVSSHGSALDKARKIKSSSRSAVSITDPDAPSALQETIIPGVKLPEELHQKWNKYGKPESEW